jgi:glycosyltransferase involved in cell wall biosynthesis
MRVLYLSYDGLCDPLGRSQILPYVLGLSKEGHLFTVISFEKKNAYKQAHAEIKSVCDQHGIKWIPLMYHRQPQVLSTLYDLWQLRRVVEKEYDNEQFHIIHCRSYITSLVGLKAKQKWGVKFIFDMRGFWADERVEGGLWSLKNPIFKLIYSFFKKKERLFLAKSDHVISLTHSAKNEIESWKIGNAPITVIPTCVDLDLFDPEKVKQECQAALREQLGIKPDEFVLLYLGSWGTWYLTDDMLNFFSLLKGKNKKAKFLIVSPDKIDLKNYAFAKDVIVTSASRRQVPLLISLAKVSICCVKPSFSKKASFATKLAEVMAMNVPMIVNRGWGDIDYLEQKMVEKIPLTNFVGLINCDYYVLNLSGLSSDLFGLDRGINKYLTVYEKLT